MIFYLNAGLSGFCTILLTALFSFVSALLIERIKESEKELKISVESAADKKIIKQNNDRRKNKILTVSVLLILAVWLFLKLSNQLYQGDRLRLFVPLGVSFYSLNLISYLADVRRNKYCAEKDCFKFLTYTLFFPHIVQGPFARYNDMSKELFQEHFFSYDRFCQGCSRILLGLFKKLIIADTLAIAVNKGLDIYQDMASLSVMLCLVLYSIQLYADFSGYMDIVSGISNIMGITMENNFEQPYFSSSIDEFWRRWHISLGKWFKDYVFFPVSMNKSLQQIGKMVRKKAGNKAGKYFTAFVALFFVWTGTGLWHGFTVNYLIWGYLNMVAIASSMYFSDTYKNIKEKLHIKDQPIWKLFCIVRTFVAVCLIRVFSITPDIKTAGKIYRKLFSFGGHGIAVLFDSIGKVRLAAVLIGVIAMLLIGILKEKKKWEKLKSGCPSICKEVIYVIMILCLILFVGESSDLTGGFLYERF